MLRLSAALLALALATPAGLEAQPHVVRAQLTSIDASMGIAPIVDRVASRQEPAWIAWMQPAAEGTRPGCCWSDGCEGCWLEGAPDSSPTVASPGATSLARPAMLLEGDADLLVLVRVAGGRVDRVRTVGASCPLDAGGLPLHVLTGVTAAHSLAWLEGEARRAPSGSGKERVAHASVHAIALHRGPEADAALERLLTGTPDVGRQVVIWLGLARGAAGLARLERLVRDEPDADTRRRAVTAIGMSREPRARTVLLDLARRHDDPRVRGDALGTVARLAGRDTAATLTEAAERDPDTEVKKKAVFGISRLPAGEGVPILIRVARDHANPAVRRAAMFWLGKSKDPRAVDFFASVLK